MTILDVRPRTIQVVLDQKMSKTVPVVVDPVGSAAGPPGRRGHGHAGRGHGHRARPPPSSSVVDRPRHAPRSTAAASTSTATSRPLRWTPAGEVVTGVDLEPALVHVTIPVYTNLENRTAAGQPHRHRHAGRRVPDRVGGRRSRSSCRSRATRPSCRPSWRRTPRRCRSPGPRGTSPSQVAYSLPTGVSRHRGPDRDGDGPHRARDRDPHVHGGDPPRRPRARAAVRRVRRPACS